MLSKALAEATSLRWQSLRERAGDDARVLKEMESLLDVHEDDASTLSPLPASFARAVLQRAAPSSWVGRRLGAYRVEALPACGDMGEVYLARRDDGQFDSRLALKCMRGTFDAQTLQPRFETERRILSSLDHPTSPASSTAASATKGCRTSSGSTWTASLWTRTANG